MIHILLDILLVFGCIIAGIIAIWGTVIFIIIAVLIVSSLLMFICEKEGSKDA